ncbi:hypothetical protein BKA59DRAFT_211289 [Fusarium tricinctum]|uniref:Uncharacterized protein n=1 Tax=Fusarium tricinctum TaxID=61284 RepID=A0A8K0RSJ3_9HYPO|nr:hypothetical protein BKA59DRAFT_211289 [Fusarium tricinctum]
MHQMMLQTGKMQSRAGKVTLALLGLAAYCQSWWWKLEMDWLKTRQSHNTPSMAQPECDTPGSMMSLYPPNHEGQFPVPSFTLDPVNFWLSELPIVLFFNGLFFFLFPLVTPPAQSQQHKPTSRLASLVGGY